MPNDVVKSYAEKSGKSVAEVEGYWDEAKKAAKEKFGKDNGDDFWAYVNGIVKRRCSLSSFDNLRERLAEAAYSPPAEHVTHFSGLGFKDKNGGHEISDKDKLHYRDALKHLKHHGFEAEEDVKGRPITHRTASGHYQNLKHGSEPHGALVAHAAGKTQVSFHPLNSEQASFVPGHPKKNKHTAQIYRELRSLAK